MTRLLPGGDGADSPLLDDGPLDAAIWNAWCAIGADRAAGKPTPLDTLWRALGTGVGPAGWMLWWDRDHPRGILTHRATLVRATLVSSCGYSTPAHGGLHAWEMGERAIRDSHRTYCTACLGVTPWLSTA